MMAVVDCKLARCVFPPDTFVTYFAVFMLAAVSTYCLMWEPLLFDRFRVDSAATSSEFRTQQHYTQQHRTQQHHSQQHHRLVQEPTAYHTHICIDGKGVFSPLSNDYYHRYLERSVFYNFKCPPNTTATSLNNTLHHFSIIGMDHFTAMSHIKIPFIAFDINNVAQRHGGDHFVVAINKSAEYTHFMKQAFKVEDHFNGRYTIHLLLPDAARYDLWIMHKFSCFDAMLNNNGHINANMSWIFLGTITVLENPMDSMVDRHKNCVHNQHGLDMLSAGVWTKRDNGNENITRWSPYCCANELPRFSRTWRFLNSNESDVSSQIEQYRVGDSTLANRDYEIGYHYTDKPRKEYFLYRVEEDAIADWQRLQMAMMNRSVSRSDDKAEKVVLMTNINLHPVHYFADPEVACNESMRFVCDLVHLAVDTFPESKIYVVFVGGTGIHEELFPRAGDLVTEYRVRYNDECMKRNIDRFNRIRKYRKGNNERSMNELSVCPGVDSKVYDIENDIYFVDISNMRIARWDINIKLRPNDKIHGFLQTTAQLQAAAELFLTGYA